MTSNPLVLTPIEGEPRVHDLQIAERLGFADRYMIRKLIKRNEAKLLKLGIVSTVETIHEGAGRPTEEFYLNQKQAIFICMKSETDRAFDVQVEIVRVFDAYLNGDALPHTKPVASIREERELQALARDTMRTLKVFGIVGNAAVLSTDNYVRAIAGRSLLEPLGATHLLADPRGRTYTPTELGRLCDPPMTAVKVNLALEQVGLQRRDMGAWMPTDNAAKLCEWLDTGKRQGNGTPVKQVKWFGEVQKYLTQRFAQAA